MAVVSEEVEEEETVEEQNRRRRGERHSRRRRRRWFSWETKERERREISSRGEVASLKAPFSSPDKRDKTATETSASAAADNRRIYDFIETPGSLATYQSLIRSTEKPNARACTSRGGAFASKTDKEVEGNRISSIRPENLSFH